MIVYILLQHFMFKTFDIYYCRIYSTFFIIHFVHTCISVTEWFKSLTSNHLPLTSLGSINVQGIKIFHTLVYDRSVVLGSSVTIKAEKVAIWPILCQCDLKTNHTKIIWEFFYASVNFWIYWIKLLFSIAETDLIRQYFFEGYTYKEILLLLHYKHPISVR